MNFDIDGFRATLDKSNGINHGNIFDVMIAPGWLGNNKISKNNTNNHTQNTLKHLS